MNSTQAFPPFLREAPGLEYLVPRNFVDAWRDSFHFSFMKKRVYVDMDDVLCDFSGRQAEHLRANPEIKYPQSQWGFFLKLAPLTGALAGIHALAEKFDTWILTRPSVYNPLCYTEKRVWVEEQLGFDWVERLIISPDKSLLMGDYLIDDSPWPGFQGEQLLFGSADFPDWTSVLRRLNASASAD